MPWISVKSYAEKAGVHNLTVRRWIHAGRLQAKKDRGGVCWLVFYEPDFYFPPKSKVPPQCRDCLYNEYANEE